MSKLYVEIVLRLKIWIWATHLLTMKVCGDWKHSYLVDNSFDHQESQLVLRMSKLSIRVIVIIDSSKLKFAKIIDCIFENKLFVWCIVCSIFPIPVGIWHVAKRLRILRTLILASCALLTDKAISYLEAYSFQLTELDVSLCPGITIEQIEHFQRSVPTVHSIKSRFISSWTFLETSQFWIVPIYTV